MHITRRSFGALVAGAVAAGLAFVLRSLWPRRVVARDWLVRRATPSDAAELSKIFNVQLRAGLCALPEKITPWTTERALAFLRVYTGTIIVARDAEPVGFVGYIDYAASDATSSVAPGVEPEVAILAVNVDVLDAADREHAVKALAASMGRDFRRMGFKGCRALVSATSGFPPLPTHNARIVDTRTVNGGVIAREMRYDIRALEDLEGEGF